MKYLIFLLLLSFSISSQDDFEEILDFDESVDMRDPFESPDFDGLEEESSSKKTSKVKKKLSKKNRKSEGLKLNLSKIEVKAIILASNNKRALVKNGKRGRELVTMTEGMKLAGRDITLKQILKKGLIFVEEITNVYGQKEYIETVIPISR